MRPMEAELFLAYRRTDMTKLIVAVRKFANASKNYRYHEYEILLFLLLLHANYVLIQMQYSLLVCVSPRQTATLLLFNSLLSGSNKQSRLSLCSRAIQYQYLFKTNKLHNIRKTLKSHF